MKLRQITFKVPAPLFGYRSQTRAGLFKKHMERRGIKLRRKDTGEKYAQYKQDVLYLAIQAGWTPGIHKGKVVGAVATYEHPVRLSVIVRWKKGPRIDWKNIYGGIEDSLWHEDSFVKPGKKSDAIYYAGVEEAEVIVEFE